MGHCCLCISFFQSRSCYQCLHLGFILCIFVLVQDLSVIFLEEIAFFLIPPVSSFTFFNFPGFGEHLSDTDHSLSKPTPRAVDIDQTYRERCEELELLLAKAQEERDSCQLKLTASGREFARVKMERDDLAEEVRRRTVENEQLSTRLRNCEINSGNTYTHWKEEERRRLQLRDELRTSGRRARGRVLSA